jgi:thiamine transport system ATP-binding protein
MLEIEGLIVRYPGFEGRYDLVVPAGAMAVIAGPSGGGKSTLLNAIAGFAEPAAGRVRFAGTDILGLPPAARPLSILFQEHNLFPHLTVAQNVGLGLDPRLRLTRDQHATVEAALADTGLAAFGRRLPGALSGGQRQRVALARALARARPLILLDEPFAALDLDLRGEMVTLVDDLRKRTGATVLMVMHTPEDAAGITDMTVRIEAGRVVKES